MKISICKRSPGTRWAVLRWTTSLLGLGLAFSLSLPVHAASDAYQADRFQTPPLHASILSLPGSLTPDPQAIGRFRPPPASTPEARKPVSSLPPAAHDDEGDADSPAEATSSASRTVRPLPRLQAGAPPLRFTLVTPNATPTPHGGIRVMALTIPAQTSQPLMMGDLGRQHAGCAASSQAQGVLQKALGLYRAGKTDEAIRSIKNALMDAPKNALLWAGLAELRIAEKDFASASEAFGRALRLEPSKEQWASRYATLLPKAMGGAAAVEALNQLAETHPNNATVLATLGALLQERGLAEQARPVLEKALALTPQDASCHYNLALALEQTGHAQDALRHYQTALNLAPRFENARLAVARLKGSS